MAQKKTKNDLNSEIKQGIVYFIIFAILVILGILVKRVFNHPEFMMLFHGPAAVFLVLAGRKLSLKLRIRYEQDSLKANSKSQS